MVTFAIPFPAVDPVLIEFGPFAIRWYALAYVAGLLIGWQYSRTLVRRDGLWGTVPRPSPLQMDDFLLWATLGVILGGRLGYVLFYNFDHYLANPSDILFVWRGGMAFHGGLLGVAVAMIAFSWNKSFSVFTLSDIISTVVTIGLFFGRIANFINGELFGRASDVPWAMVFPNGGPEPRHPSQLYEAGLEGLFLFLLLSWMAFRHGAYRVPGLVTGTFIAAYGLARFSVEFFREPDAHIGFLAGWLTMGMILSLPMVAVGAALILWALKRRGAAE